MLCLIFVTCARTNDSWRICIFQKHKIKARNITHTFRCEDIHARWLYPMTHDIDGYVKYFVRPTKNSIFIYIVSYIGGCVNHLNSQLWTFVANISILKLLTVYGFDQNRIKLCFNSVNCDRQFSIISSVSICPFICMCFDSMKLVG